MLTFVTPAVGFDPQALTSLTEAEAAAALFQLVSIHRLLRA